MSRVAVVTGASRGIGRAAALELARGGADLALFGRDETALAQTAAAVRAARPNAVTSVHAFDPTSEWATRAAVAEVLAAHGRIDVAVVNAGQSVDGLLLPLQPADIERLLATNLESAFYLCAAAAEPMLRRRGGAIVLVSPSACVAGKAALMERATSLAKALGPHGVRVSVVEPGLVEAQTSAALPPAARLRHAELIALGRTGSPAEVASAVALLAADDARSLAGQRLLVGGGAAG